MYINYVCYVMQGARYTQSDVCGVGNEVTIQLKFESDKLTLVTPIANFPRSAAVAGVHAI